VEDVSFRVVGLPPSKPCIRHRAAYAAARTLSKRLAIKHSPAGIQNFDASGTAHSYANILVTLVASRSLDVGLLPANLDHMDYDMSYSHRYTRTVARLIQYNTASASSQSLGQCTRPVGLSSPDEPPVARQRG
jgi:hypothetical protein